MSSSCVEQSTNWILKQKRWGYTVVLATNLISKLPFGINTKRIFERTVQRIIVWSLFQAQNLHCAPFSDDEHLSFHRQSQALCLTTPNAFLEIRWACREQDAAQKMSSHGRETNTFVLWVFGAFFVWFFCFVFGAFFVIISTPSTMELNI